MEPQPMQLSLQQESSNGGRRSAIYINGKSHYLDCNFSSAGVEIAERFAYYGMLGNLITYLTDVLGGATATSAKNVNIWIRISTLLPLLGAVIADSFLGRLKTIFFSSIIYLMVGWSSLVDLTTCDLHCI
uniref:Uncharacterized protein n=1 Tax=Nelumbo nucifera TaxID=4432 RepID=A0A822YCV5_NELNU|nr:TPA_asm: hypothetical protein HUJ06_030819 [Nelumbo nucifera]